MTLEKFLKYAESRDIEREEIIGKIQEKIAGLKRKSPNMTPKDKKILEKWDNIVLENMTGINPPKRVYKSILDFLYEK